MTDPTPTPPASKPEVQQVSNYVGAALIAAAGYLVANQDVVLALIPAPWHIVATVVVGAVGAGLVAYREKAKTP